MSPAPLSPYHRRLFVFLSVATFFEGYDFTAFSQILPNVRADMGLSEGAGGLLGSAISAGTIVAYVLVRLADRWGRRRVLALTILGYAAFTFLTALARTPYDFAAFQFVARMFLIGEWALSMVIAAEEFPAERRGLMIGMIQAFNSLGSIACAAIAPILLATPLSWRAVYLVGVLPLLLLAYARRGLRETARFEQYAAERGTERRSFTAILRGPYRHRVLQLALIWGLTYICTNTAVLFWKEFAVAERGFSDAAVGKAVVIASLAAMPLVFGVGRLLDAWGRRRGAVFIYGLGAVFIVLAYQLHGFWLLTFSLMGAIYTAIALLTLLNTFTTELFPTEMRADAFAWSNNLLGRIGYVIAPFLVGSLAEVIGWGNAVTLTVVAVLAALALVLWWLPETRGQELEQAAAL